MKRKILSIVITALLSTTVSTHTIAADLSKEGTTTLSENAFSEEPWLRSVLPATTLLYARIPSLLNSISSKDDSFKYALGNESYTQAITSIKNSSMQWIKKADKEIQPFLSLMIGQLNGPIEIAAIANGPIPQVLITASLNIESADEINTLIASLIKAKVIRSEKTPFADGAGELITNLGPTPYRWDQENKQLKLLMGLGGANIAQLDSVFSKLTQNPDSPMLANEAQMDSSTKGLYVWFNNKVAYQMYSPLIPSHLKQQLKLFGVPQMESLALSWGVRNEKGRIKVLLEAPQKGVIRELIPANNNTFDVTTAGAPNFTAVIALPSAEEFNRIEQTILSMSGKGKSYLKAKQTFSDKMGFSIEDILSSIGPEIIGISDQVGEYSAIKIRDKDKFNQLLSTLKTQAGLEVTTKEIAGALITHLKLPSFIDSNMTDTLKDIPPFLSDILTKASSHLYLQEEGDYLILSDLPQILFDRQIELDENSNSATLADWLKNTQKQDLSASTIALTGSVSNSPRKLYYTYLSVIQFLADITGAQIDTFSLPSAKQLKLAKEGTLGLQIDSSDKSLGLELTFESTPLDLLLTSQGFASIASIGVLSAVALPAYKDYTFKAATTYLSSDIENTKQLVQQKFIEIGRMPNAQEAADLGSQLNPRGKYSLSIEANTGTIIVDLVSKPGKKISVEPLITEGNLNWTCRSNLSYKNRLTNCKTSL